MAGGGGVGARGILKSRDTGVGGGEREGGGEVGLGGDT